MNQENRYVSRMCAICNEHIAKVRQFYNRHISDYEDCEMPICDVCKRKRYLERGGEKQCQ